MTNNSSINPDINSNIPIDCYEITHNKIIVFQDKGNSQKLTLKNEHNLPLTKIKVDGCAITNQNYPNQEKCDFMLTINLVETHIEYYIELKGSDIEKAVNQITNTIRILSTVPKSQLKKGYIICNRSPLSSTKVQNIQKDVRKSCGLELVVRSSPYTDIIKQI